MGAGDAALENLSAAFFHTDVPDVTKIRGIIASANHTGVGQWLIELRESLPIGEYLAGAQFLNGGNSVNFSLVDLGPTTKVLESYVGAVLADLNGICAWWSRAFNNGA